MKQKKKRQLEDIFPTKRCRDLADAAVDALSIHSTLAERDRRRRAAMVVVVALLAVAIGTALAWLLTPHPVAAAGNPASVWALDTQECRTAVHESGHAIAAWSCSIVHNVSMTTIEAAHGGSVKFSMSLVKTDDAAWCMLVISLAGMAAEAMVYPKSHARAAQNDLVAARKLSRQLAGSTPPWPSTSLFQVMPFDRMYKEPLSPAELLVLNHGYRMAKHVLKAHGGTFYKLIALLLKQRSASEEDVKKLLGGRAFVRIVGMMRPTFVLPKPTALTSSPP